MAANFKSVDAKTAKLLFDSGARVIDVRSEMEWTAGHVEGSDRVNSNRLSAKSIGRADAVIVVCRNGSKSKKAARKLAKEGYRVYHLRGGLQAWQELGLTLVSTSGSRATA